MAAELTQEAETLSVAAWRILLRKRSFAIGVLLSALIVLPTVLAPLLPLSDPARLHITDLLKPPLGTPGGSFVHLLGTDNLGRDLLSRTVYGGRTSLVMAGLALAIALGLGITIGTVAAYFGGRLETLLMRLVELQIAFPFIILALALLTVFRISIPLLILVLVLSSWGAYARTFRGIVLSEKKRTYVLAARAIGASTPRVLINHILRTILPAVLVFATIDLTYLVTLEAALSFVGLGVQPPTPSWGNIMGDGKDYLDTAWWIAVVPGLFLVTFSLGFNLMGDALEDLLAPDLRR